MTTLEELSDDQRAALAAIVGGRFAWTPVVEMAGSADTLATLVTLGLAARWTARGIDAVTLTPWGAWVMNVEIIERVRIVGDELEEDPVWADRPAVPPRLRLPRRAHEVRFPWMETFPDPLPGPEEYLIDEASGKPLELFAKLFDGEWIGGVKVKIDRRIRRAKKAKAGKARRRAG
jgi:hypothetical protein